MNRDQFVNNIIVSLLVSDNPDINILKECNHFLRQKERDILSRKIDIDILLKYPKIKWSISVIKKRPDIRMRHLYLLRRLNITFTHRQLEYLTTKELKYPCEIGKNIDFPWSKNLLHQISIKNCCEEHLLTILSKYNDIKLDSKKITRKISLDGIISHKNYKYWDKLIMTNRSHEEKRIEDFLVEAPSLLLLNVVQDMIPWKMIAKYSHLPWDLHDRIINIYDHTTVPTLYEIRKLIKKNLALSFIAEGLTYDYLYLGNDIPFTFRSTFLKSPLYHLYCNTCNKINLKDTDMKEYTRKYVSKNKWDFIKENISINWDTKELVKRTIHSTAPPLVLLKHYINAKWDWEYFSKHYSFKDILNTPYLKWNMNVISERKNIPFEFIKEFITKWDINNIRTSCQNEMRILIVLPLLQNKLCFDLIPSIISFIL